MNRDANHRDAQLVQELVRRETIYVYMKRYKKMERKSVKRKGKNVSTKRVVTWSSEMSK